MLKLRFDRYIIPNKTKSSNRDKHLTGLAKLFLVAKASVSSKEYVSALCKMFF